MAKIVAISPHLAALRGLKTEFKKKVVKKYERKQMLVRNPLFSSGINEKVTFAAKFTPQSVGYIASYQVEQVRN